MTVMRVCSRDTEGSSLVEFAIALATLLTAIIGTVSGALALFAYHYTANAAREGARYAMVRGSTWKVACATPSTYGCTATGDSVKAFLVAIAPTGMKSANTAVTTTWPGTTAAGTACYGGNGANGPGCSVKVSVTYTFRMTLPLLPKKTLQFSSSSTMPISQ